MTLLTDLSAFTRSHHPHGPLTTDATEPRVEWLSAHGGVSVWRHL
jgi:hypothetical protein